MTTPKPFTDPKWEEMADRQAHANRLAEMNDDGPARAYAYLKALFIAEHAKYPQYAGWTDDTVLVVFRSRITGKGGVRFEAGDVAIAQRYRPGYFGQSGDQTAYAARVGWNVAVGLDHPRVLFDPAI